MSAMLSSRHRPPSSHRSGARRPVLSLLLCAALMFSAASCGNSGSSSSSTPAGSSAASGSAAQPGSSAPTSGSSAGAGSSQTSPESSTPQGKTSAGWESLPEEPSWHLAAYQQTADEASAGDGLCRTYLLLQLLPYCELDVPVGAPGNGLDITMDADGTLLSSMPSASEGGASLEAIHHTQVCPEPDLAGEDHDVWHDLETYVFEISSPELPAAEDLFVTGTLVYFFRPDTADFSVNEVGRLAGQTLTINAEVDDIILPETT